MHVFLNSERRHQSVAFNIPQQHFACWAVHVAIDLLHQGRLHCENVGQTIYPTLVHL